MVELLLGINLVLNIIIIYLIKKPIKLKFRKSNLESVLKRNSVNLKREFYF